MLETNGWDTHSGQAPRIANQLKQLDAMVAALRDGLGAAWAETTVLVATEFGRTAAANGTGGTDHGTASAAMLLGGAVQGGRVLADWPGLAPAALFQGRDLQPTTRMDALIAAATGECFGIDPERVKADLLAVGFKFDGASQILANPADDHMKIVFAPEIRGKTDQFLFRFRKPK